MSTQTSPPVRFFIPTALFLAVVGWGGLSGLLIFTFPTLGPRWLFFFLVVIAVAGTILPAAAYLNLRFPSLPPATPNVIIRQSTWAGVYTATLAWLQIGRVLTVPMALLLLVGIGLVEFLIRLSERSQWKPQPPTEPDQSSHE